MASFMQSKEFEHFCHDVFDNLPIAVDFLDWDGKIIYMNEVFLDFLNLRQDEVKGRLVTDVNPTSKFLETLKTKRANIAERHVFPNGRQAIVHRIPIFDEEGNVIGGFGMLLFHDIEEVKELAEKYEKLDKELKLYKNEIAKINTTKYRLSDIYGVSKEINNCKRKVKKIAKVNSNVMILGESGVGKELFAHSIHNESSRNKGPFVTINCSAIPESLLESELFGYEEGTFTGAKKGGNIGKFELANGGSILLDEIGDMPYHMQVKLLRVLQEKEVIRIGGKNPIPIDVRIICATNKNLEEMLEKGTFREDLYYRLNVLTLEIPPIRKRREDIPILINKFLIEFYQETGIYRNIPDIVMKRLKEYDWHGNVREIRNVVERMCVNSDGTNIGISDIPKYVLNKSLEKKYKDKKGLKEIVESVERNVIIEVLKDSKGNKSKAAKALNIPRATLYRKIEDYNIDEKTFLDL